MNTNLIFFYGQLWWSLFYAEIKVPAISSSPMYLYPTSKFGDLIENGRNKATTEPSSTVKTWVTEHQEPPLHDGHLIAASLIGAILLSMILVMIGIFLWKRWRHTDSPLPHWAGRSPFADGDIPDAIANKEAMHGTKRTSVLSLLPWRFNKDTQLLDSEEGQLSESRASLDVLSCPGAEEIVGQSSPTATRHSVSSTSMQTSVCDTPGTPADVPLQPTIPEPLDLPPPPNWLNGVNGELCPTGNKSHLLEEKAEAQCSVAPDLIHQHLDEELLPPPPPPEDFNLTV